MNIRRFSSSPISFLIHVVFGLIYILLVVRAAVSLYQGPTDYFQPPPIDSLIVTAIKRTAGIIYSPFWLMSGYPTIGGPVVTTILFAVFGYALLHFGIFITVPTDRRGSMVNKVLDFCRTIFFLAGTLLVLLMVARMGVMLYQDVTFGRFVIGVPARK